MADSKGFREVDTGPFDRAVAGIMSSWKRGGGPPPDIKKVIVTELGAVLKECSKDTLVMGPKGKKNTTIGKGRTYAKKRYTWKAQTGRGRRATQTAESVPVVWLGKKRYFRANRYPTYIWAMIQKRLNQMKKQSLKSVGSSKAMWWHIYLLSKKAAGVSVPDPNAWHDLEKIRGVRNTMLKRGGWSKHGTASRKRESAGDFVLKIWSDSRNTLNKSTGGVAAFQKRLDGRAGYFEKAAGKKCYQTIKQLTKKYKALSVNPF